MNDKFTFQCYSITLLLIYWIFRLNNTGLFDLNIDPLKKSICENLCFKYCSQIKIHVIM